MNTNVDIIMQAIMRGDDEIRVEARNSLNWLLPLPTPQRSGTHTQQSTYARMKARRMVELVANIMRTNEIKFSQV